MGGDKPSKRNAVNGVLVFTMCHYRSVIISRVMVACRKFGGSESRSLLKNRAAV